MKTYIRIIETLRVKGERGSLSLENVLFISAVAAIGAAVTGFWTSIDGYLTGTAANMPAPSNPATN